MVVGRSGRAERVVAGQSLPHRRHQRVVAREEHRVVRVGPLAVPRGHVLAHERFAGSRNAGDKHDRLPPPGLRRGDDLLDAPARGGDVHGPCVAEGDVVDRVAGVERRAASMIVGLGE